LCPDHAICRGGDVIDVRPGYWRLGSEYDAVKLCLAKDACHGGDDPETQCREGHKGPYCSVCQDGYYKHGGYCLKCSSSGARLIMALVPTLCFLLCLLLYYLWIIRDQFLHYFWDQAGVLAKKAETYHLTSLRTKFKILLAFVQIITQIPFALDVDFPQIYLQFLDILWIFNLDFVEFLNFECIYKRNFYDKLVEATLGPFLLIGLIFLILIIRLFLAYRLNHLNPSYTFSQFYKEIIFCSLLISFIVFSPVSIKIFQTFACEKFENGKSFLITDYTISCSGSEYSYYFIYSLFMILIYPIGVPTLYFILLYINYQHVNPPTSLVVLDSERDLVSTAVIQSEKIKLRNSYSDIFVISFLYMAYEPRRWYFEILDCFRRLMMTAVPVLIMRGAITQIVIVLLVSLACVAAYMELKPFATPSDNTVAVLSQWAITLTLVVSILIRIGEEQGLNRQSLGIIAIFINTTVFVVTILLICFGNEELNPSEDIQTLETQLSVTAPLPKKKSMKMTLSSFIDATSSRQSVEMVEKEKTNRVGEGGQVIETESIDLRGVGAGGGGGSGGGESIISRRASLRMKQQQGKERTDSAAEESSPSKQRGGVRGSILVRRSSMNSKKEGEGEEPTSLTEDSSPRRGSVLGRRRSITSSRGGGQEEKEVELSVSTSSSHDMEQRVSRLVNRDEKDSDDESDSDDDHGDSDDDTPTTKHKHGVVTNPMSRRRI
jgi:hypothetical protein